MGDGAPGVARQRFEAADRLDPSHGLLHIDFPRADPAQRRAAMGAFELFELSGAVLEVFQRHPAGRGLQMFERRGGGAEGLFPRNVVNRRHGRAHRVDAKRGGAPFVLALAGQGKFGLLAGGIDQPRHMVQGVEGAGQTKIFALRNRAFR